MHSVEGIATLTNTKADDWSGGVTNPLGLDRMGKIRLNGWSGSGELRDSNTNTTLNHLGSVDAVRT